MMIKYKLSQTLKAFSNEGSKKNSTAWKFT